MKLKSLALLLMTIAMPAMAEQVSVNSKGISLILDVENGKPAQYLYFGSKLNAADLQNLTVATNGRYGCLSCIRSEYSCRSCTRHASQRW